MGEKKESSLKMSTAVFSDLHLRLPFEEKKFLFLEKVFRLYDQIILNGDFWDGYIITFESFLLSPWRNLFPILKKRKTIYLYGNHDKKIFQDGRCQLFSEIQGPSYQLPVDGQVFLFEHGNRLYPTLDDRLKLKRVPRKLQRALIYFHDYFVRKKRKEFLRHRFSKHNQLVKRKLKENLSANQFFICGHTHWGEIDKKSRFANSGIVGGGLGQYLVIESGGKISLQEEYYE